MKWYDYVIGGLIIAAGLGKCVVLVLHFRLKRKIYVAHKGAQNV